MLPHCKLNLAALDLPPQDPLQQRGVLLLDLLRRLSQHLPSRGRFVQVPAVHSWTGGRCGSCGWIRACGWGWGTEDVWMCWRVLN